MKKGIKKPFNKESLLEAIKNVKAASEELGLNSSSVSFNEGDKLVYYPKLNMIKAEKPAS